MAPETLVLVLRPQPDLFRWMSPFPEPIYRRHDYNFTAKNRKRKAAKRARKITRRK